MLFQLVPQFIYLPLCAIEQSHARVLVGLGDKDDRSLAYIKETAHFGATFIQLITGCSFTFEPHTTCALKADLSLKYNNECLGIP